MDRYINGDTVFFELTNHYKTAKGEARKAWREALDIVTAVEEIEVVRCKECRHRPLMVDGDVKDPNYNESAWEEDYTCPLQRTFMPLSKCEVEE